MLIGSSILIAKNQICIIISNPRVIPVTAHAAIDKGCFYLNIEARKARLNSNFEVDINHMKSLIDKNTIMILGSAPNYPHGIVDPIE